MRVSIIVAMTPERLIGAAGRLPWHLPDDLKHFRNLTTGHCVVMGRKTFSSIGRPLPKRRNLVITRNPAPPVVPGVEWFHNVNDAIAAARNSGETELFIAGGSEIYAQAFPLTDRLYITFVHRDFPFQGDTYFPPWDQTQWHPVSHELKGDCEFVTYERSAPRT